MESYKHHGHINLSMATKAEMEEEINSTLGLDLEWSKMKKEDLEELQLAIESGDLVAALAKEMAKDEMNEFLEEQIDDWRPGQLLF